MDAAVKHLRGICGDAMDKLKGDNYEVRAAAPRIATGRCSSEAHH